jgi:hypothetical protein
MNKLKLAVLSLFMGLSLTTVAQKVNFDYKVDSVTTGTLNGDSITTQAFPTTIRFEKQGDSAIVKIGVGKVVKAFVVVGGGTASTNRGLCVHKFTIKDADGKLFPFGIIFIEANHKVIAVAVTEGNWTILFHIKDELTLEG